MGKATSIQLSSEDKEVLEAWMRAGSTEHRFVQRASYILAAAEGLPTGTIASEAGVRPATVSKWRTRFAKHGLKGLQDAPRPGARRLYGRDTDKRVLTMLDEPPPRGHATWTGSLLAAALGDVPAGQVWAVLRRYGIQLQRRRSWCISTDPEFAAKAADIVALYLDPPDNAVVLCVDEKPNIQAARAGAGIPQTAQRQVDDGVFPHLQTTWYHDALCGARSGHGEGQSWALQTPPAA